MGSLLYSAICSPITGSHITLPQLTFLITTVPLLDSSTASIDSPSPASPASLVLTNSRLESQYLLVKTQRRCRYDAKLPCPSRAVITEAGGSPDCYAMSPRCPACLQAGQGKCPGVGTGPGSVQ